MIQHGERGIVGIHAGGIKRRHGHVARHNNAGGQHIQREMGGNVAVCIQGYARQVGRHNHAVVKQRR